MEGNSKDMDHCVTLFKQLPEERVTLTQSRWQTVSFERFHQIKDGRHGASK